MSQVDVHPSVIAMRTTILGIILSVVLVVVKGFAGYWGHSFALIADATESAADIVSSGLLLFGLHISLKKPDTDHPYGHGKAEPIAAMAVSLFLFATAVWIAYHAIVFIQTPHSLPKGFTLWILLIIIACKESMYRYVMNIGKKINSEAVKADAIHHRSDTITSVAAFIGISIALIGGDGYETADDWAALVASCLIFYNATQIMLPALAEVMDAAPSQEIVLQVRKIASGVSGVKRIEKCFVRKMGFDYYADIHVEVDGNLSVFESHAIAHRVKDAILNSNLRMINIMVHIEPFQ